LINKEKKVETCQRFAGSEDWNLARVGKEIKKIEPLE
jgi:hypothetical protein